MSDTQRTRRDRLDSVVAWANANATEEDEWDADFALLPSTVRLMEREGPFVLYATKSAALFGLFKGEMLPDTPLFIRYWPTPAWSAQLASDLARRHGGRVRFVGDLDPLDLLAFFSLWATLDESVTLEHVGVGERWLRRLRLERCTIAMAPFELRLWREVRQLTDWASVVGPDGVAMLDEGRKVETEGAMNPLLHSEEALEATRAELLAV